VVAQDAEFLVAEGCGDAPATIDRKHLHFLIVEKCLIEHEGTRLLTDRAERLNVGRPWCAEGGMRVRCADDVGTGSEQTKGSNLLLANSSDAIYTIAKLCVRLQAVKGRVVWVIRPEYRLFGTLSGCLHRPS
jgi:hypothetical protein